MKGAPSAPTARTIDIVELLAKDPSNKMRYVDIVRELGLNSGTAHTILKTLVDREWVSRDPVDKTFSLGPAISLLTSKVDQVRLKANAARLAAQHLAEETGFATSVVELIGQELCISASFQGDELQTIPNVGTKVPYAPPYGAAFAAASSESECQAWLARSTTKNPKVTAVLNQTLSLVRERGYDIDWTTSSVQNLAAMLGTQKEIHPSLIAAMDEILLELTTLSFDKFRGSRAVTSIWAAIANSTGKGDVGIAIHPMRPLPLRKIKSLGRHLVDEISTITG